MEQVRKRYVFHGRVQGVGFRFTASYYAKSLGLTGWVKNEYDSTVVMEVQGSPAMIQKLLESIVSQGHIRIDWIDTEDLPLGKEKRFSVLY